MKKLLSYILFAATLSSCFLAFGQSKKTTVKSKESKTETADLHHDNLNKRDNKGHKQGLWFYKHDARMGEPLTYEYGQYIDDKKEGNWTTLDALQRLSAIENYHLGVLDGTSQYYESGRLVCIGNYRGLDQSKEYETIAVTDPDTYIDTMVTIRTDIGATKHGMWRYYDAITGQMTREQEYQIDYLIYEKTFRNTAAADSVRNVKRVNTYISDKKNYYKPPAGKNKSLIK